jgi:hypothetical protein
MNARRILLRVLLLSLAVAAVVGAASVLFLPADDVWRIFGTGILTAAGCGILLPVSLLTDKPKSRSAGLLGMAVVLLEYLLGLSLIWGSATNWSDSLLEQLAFAALFLPAVGLPAVALMRIAGTHIGRWAGRIGVWLMAVEFILLMLAVRMDWLQSSDDRGPATAGVCAIFFPLLIMSLAGLGAVPGALWRWPAIALSVISLAVSLAGIWRSVPDHPGAFALLVTIPTVLAYFNLAMLCPLKRGQIWVRWVAVVSVVATAVCVDFGVFLDAAQNGELFARLAAATGIIAGCATLALAILAALNRKLERPTITLDNVHSLDVICPLCRKKQKITTGGASCAECGLRIVVNLEQPQCAKCGYILYGLKFERCPECGTVVAVAGQNSNECSTAPVVLE